MKNWNLTSGDPGAFTIAADARCGNIDFTNDHIWELKLDGGEPSALAIQTTYGLRARSQRLFPRFVEKDTAVIDPAGFATHPRVTRFYPNYLKVQFSPFIGIDVVNEYWVPNSNVLTGRIQVTNSRLTSRQIHVQWASILSPIGQGQRMAHHELEAATILRGHTEAIFPVIFMTGGPRFSTGPYPALSVDMDLAAGVSQHLVWVHSAMESYESSFETSRKIAAKSWDAEIARLDMVNQSLLSIETGDQDWDAAFALAQKCAYGLLIEPAGLLPDISFVSSRQPDQGYSSLGAGSDIDHLWDIQTPLDAAYLSTFLLPNSPDLVEGFLRNFLATQTQGGFINHKPGSTTQRSRMLAMPILAKLAWKIYETTEDEMFLKTVSPRLLGFLQAWFSEQQDRDGDGLPEWTQTSQSGYEDHPIFSQWNPWAQGGDISKVESPSLCAFLFSDINSLINITHITQQSNPVVALEAFVDNLKTAVHASWDNSDSLYRNWDRESHTSTNGEFLGRCIGPGEIQLNREFVNPVRLSIRVVAEEELPVNIRIFIHGIGSSQNPRIETLENDQILWHINTGNISSERIFQAIDYIEIIGIGKSDRISVEVMDLSVVDHTLLLPLWAGIPDDKRASEFVKKTITNPSKFWKSYGIAACPQKSEHGDSFAAVHMIWNTLIGEGLLKYGYRENAVDLVTRLMTTVISNLKSNHSFYEHYHAETGRGIGKRNTLGGLAPLSLFLETLGVRIISPEKVYLVDRNPFPWPVTIRFRGLTVYREIRKTKVVFPGGQTAIVKSREPRLVTLENLL